MACLMRQITKKNLENKDKIIKILLLGFKNINFETFIRLDIFHSITTFNKTTNTSIFIN